MINKTDSILTLKEFSAGGEKYKQVKDEVTVVTILQKNAV